jgi:hypothetical protein
MRKRVTRGVKREDVIRYKGDFLDGQSDILNARSCEAGTRYAFPESFGYQFRNSAGSKAAAILATDSTMIRYARSHALLTQGSRINLHVFIRPKRNSRLAHVPADRLA